jgi:hypothetical protein
MGRPQGFDRGRAKVRNRRLSPVAVPPGEGRLTEQTAGVQPAQSEQVFMPHRRPCRHRRERILARHHRRNREDVTSYHRQASA